MAGAAVCPECTQLVLASDMRGRRCADCAKRARAERAAERRAKQEQLDQDWQAYPPGLVS